MTLLLEAIQCPICKKKGDFDSFELTEAATLICPNCSAEFSLTAELTKLPDGAEEEPGLEPELEPEFELPEPPGPEMPSAPSAGEAPPEVPPESREPVIRTSVLCCSDCKADWIGVHTSKCPKCGSKKVLASAKTKFQRALDTLDEVKRGVPVERALAKLTGKFEKAPAKGD